MFTHHVGRLVRLGLMIMLVGLLSSSITAYAQDPFSSQAFSPNPPTQPLEMNIPHALSTVPTSCSQRKDTWITTSVSPTFVPILSCTLYVPTDGIVFINATASLMYITDIGKAVFRLGIDNNLMLSTERLVNVYTDTVYLPGYASSGSDKSFATSLYMPINAGVHRFTLLGAKAEELGNFNLVNPALNVLFIQNPPPSVTPDTIVNLWQYFWWFVDNNHN